MHPGGYCLKRGLEFQVSIDVERELMMGRLIRQDLVGALRDLCPQSGCCSQGALGLLCRVTGAVAVRWSSRVFFSSSSFGYCDMSWSLPFTLHPNSPRKKLEPQISFSESVGGGMELLAGKNLMNTASETVRMPCSLLLQLGDTYREGAAPGWAGCSHDEQRSWTRIRWRTVRPVPLFPLGTD